MRIKPYSIEISDEAELDFDKSYNYYYEENPKVADSFFRSINLAFKNIKKTPKSFPLTHKDIRKYIVKKFPFVVYFRIVDSLIQVIAIFHTSRNPEIWNKRI